MTRSTSLPNIVYIMFDDLGFNDVGYNGGDYPTVLLDDLSSKGIKMNFVYAEQLCSPSRSALHTGRHSWRSGLNSEAALHSRNSYDITLTLFTELLKRKGYENHFAGKWHIGHQFSKAVPVNRGFDSGLYAYTSNRYTSRGKDLEFTTLEETIPIDSSSPVAAQRDRFWPSGTMFSHDMVELKNSQETPIHIGDTTYVDTLYKDHLLQFISTQTATTPFSANLNFYTPHSHIEEPPELIPGYKTKNQMTSEYRQCNIGTLTNDKKIFCRQMRYAELCIQQIIDKLKDQNLYDNTVVVITSDNGVHSGPDSAGQTLPLRGVKGGSFEGGIRVPAFLTGGYIDSLTDGCEYDELVHISDWYHIFMSMVHVTPANERKYRPDSDHKQTIWEDIKCTCNPKCDPRTRGTVPRAETMQIKLCGDSTDSSRSLYSSYMIRDGYKLVVNGATELWATCPTLVDAFQSPGAYEESDGTEMAFPDQNFYNNFYEPQFKMNSVRATKLFYSNCLENLRPVDRNNAAYDRFKFKEKLLYNLSIDRIEACNVDGDIPWKTTELYDTLFKRSGIDYNVQIDDETSMGAIYNSFLNYDCDNDVIVVSPWEGKHESVCDGSESDCTEKVWKVLVDKRKACPVASPAKERNYNDANVRRIFQRNGTVIFTQIIVVMFICTCGVFIYCTRSVSKDTFEYGVLNDYPWYKETYNNDSESDNECYQKFDNV